MSVLEIKQQISRLSARDRNEVQAYLLRVKRATPEWRKATAKKIRELQAGKGVPIEELEARLARR
jgi:thiamine monophosphate synthase